MNSENLPEDLEELIEEKVEERFQNKKEQFKREVKQELSEDEKPERIQKDRDVSRRSFLKKLGAGALGLGALGLSPVSSLKLTRNDVLKGGSPAFLDTSGSNVMRGSLSMNNNVITDLGDPSAPQDAATRGWTNSNFNLYTDSQARTAVDGANISITGDADTVDGKDASQLGNVSLEYVQYSDSVSSTSSSTRTYSNIDIVLRADISADSYSNEGAGATVKVYYKDGSTNRVSISEGNGAASSESYGPRPFTTSNKQIDYVELDIYCGSSASATVGGFRVV